MKTQPAREVDVESHFLTPGNGFPNNWRLPLLVYRRAFAGGRAAANEIERRLVENGWAGTWQNGVYSYHHFHSNAHEVLAVCSGRARLQFGGPAGPVVDVEAGDVAVLPAGTGHKRVEASGDFLVVGGYPKGQEDYDLLRGDPAEQSEAEQRIAAVPLPAADPLYGADGPLLEHWAGD